ncbi:Synaptic glycoprotein SC2 [Giardia muris]|uniref:Synaptic glycoprotein SC2 n=1 Tax=Giardia muris TaxID=5742 RepID=A0A4Z1T5U2_GIAMU|nr:Synaptic glycoprotein SC2 [Giardia muris]|eukprot:TNJ29423.1 Synaptic glycoprotein SC2 [Giardia muris]
MLLIIKRRSGEARVEVPDEMLVSEATRRVCEELHLPPARTRFYLEQALDGMSEGCSDTGTKTTKCIKRVYLLGEIPINRFGKETLTLGVKDMGSQVSYRGVFLLEYAGPLLIWIGMYSCSSIRRSSIFTKLATIMWVFHYCKRLFETLFVHTFSQATMPMYNLVKNCTYYWGFAVAISWHVLYYSPGIDVQKSLEQWEELLQQFRDTQDKKYVLTLSRSISEHLFFNVTLLPVIFFFLFETLNFYCHIKLRNLRKEKGKEKGKGSEPTPRYLLPVGFLFNRITCPNYTMEVLSWVSFTLFTHSWVSALFTLCGFVQMLKWADQRHKKLMELYPEVQRRWRIFPLI